MISAEDNNVRNEVMRNVMNKQMRRRNLHNFVRNEKATILAQRVAKDDTTQASSEPKVQPRKSTDKRFKTDTLESRLKNEFTDYAKSIVTKQSANPNQQKVQSN